MDNILISTLAAEEIDWGLVGSTVVTGLVIVFLILAVLVLFLWAFGKIFKAINDASDKRERKKLIARNDHLKSFRLDKPSDKPAAPASPSSEPEPEIVYEDEDDEEIIAVIAAAIAAYGAAEGKQYRITRVQRPKSARSGWSAAGIADNMRGFIN